MKITHGTIEQFYESINQLVINGLLFEANRDTLIIKLTGGY